VADIFVSYTSADRDWAFWIGQELLKLGHAPHIDAWEIPGGGDIAAWMDERHQNADHILCVISKAYLDKPHANWERRSAMWAAQTDRPNFALPVRVEECKLPNLLASVKHCDLFGNDESIARKLLIDFLKPAGRPALQASFPGTAKPAVDVPKSPLSFPGAPRAFSNIPIAVPRHFLGRDDVLAKIKDTLADDQGRGAIAVLYGLRGVGKTTLAAAYAERHRGDYRATWWIRAETESTMRADLVGLGVRLGWVASEDKEEPALATVMERLRDEGAGILLIVDNAINADSVEAYFPSGGDSHVLVTSNAHAWRDVATPLQIDTWPNETGADYLISRTGRKSEREAALALSNALGGLPLAHEQAAAYCERLEVPLATYQERHKATPVDLLDDARDAPRAYHNRLTVAKTFALAIDEAAKQHPAAKPLIVYAAQLAPEPIPLFLFSEAREKFDEPLASNLAGDGLDEAVAALRAFALIERETIPDEREPAILTDCIRLHRLVRQVAAVRGQDLGANARRALIAALVEVYPGDVSRSPAAWPRARRLDALAMALVAGDALPPDNAETAASRLLNQLALYRQGALAAYAQARPLIERALAICEGALGPDEPDTAASLHNLGGLLDSQGDFEGARSYYERALAIREKVLGPDHPDTATSLNNLGCLLQAQDHLQDHLESARPYYERALAIREKVLGSDHPDTATSLDNLGCLLYEQDEPGARLYFDRALAIREKALGPDHPDTATSLNNLGDLLDWQGDPEGARPHYERALAIREKALGPDHPTTATIAGNTAAALDALRRRKEAKALREKFDIKD
jgi:tetratricopeptide (TPR) repeat protein